MKFDKDFWPTLGIISAVAVGGAILLFLGAISVLGLVGIFTRMD